MSFKGTYSKIKSNRLAGDIIVSFSLECTNMLFGESIDVGLFPSDGSQPWFFRDLKFKPGQTYIFNFDTVDWYWYQGDYAAIIDKNNKILSKWQFQMKEYKPGECPECHGTKKCKACNGQGLIYPPNKPWEFQTCQRCGGTGECSTCDVPIRKPNYGGGPTGLKPF